MKKAKRALSLVLILILVLLCGCGQTETTDEEPTATPTATPEPTAEPTPSPTPVPVVAIEDYQYYVVTNTTLAVSFKYPSHWINTPGKSTICYVEPVNSGDLAARLAVTSKVLSKKPETKQIKTQLSDFMTLVSENCDNYEEGELKEDVAIMDVEGIRQKYTARDRETGKNYTGYVLICYVHEARRLYLLHFTAPTEDYDSLSAVIDVIRDSMSTT
jgi:hypothetical protein